MNLLGILREENLRTVDCGCPGGKNGNAEASTALSRLPPITIPLEYPMDLGMF
jgi:hypothetical protein